MRISRLIWTILALLTVSASIYGTDRYIHRALPSDADATASLVALAANTAPSPTAAAEAAAVRIDANGYFVGTGTIVSEGGHVLTSVQVVSGWRYAKYTIGNDRLPASVEAIDEAHGIAVLCTSSAVGKPARLTAARSGKNAPVVLSGYRLVQSDPPMITQRKETGYVVDPSFSGESSGTLDLHDLMLVRLKGGESFRPKAEGLPVIAAKTGVLEGVVIGQMERSGGYDLLVIPASTASTFLTAHGVTLP